MAKKTDDNTFRYFATGTLLLVDFFGYNWFSGIDTFLVYFPMITVFPIFFAVRFTESKFAWWALVFILVIFVGASTTFAQDYSGTVDLVENAEGKKTTRETIDDFLNSIFGTGGLLEERIDYAITGRVEENKAEPLGVYLENVRASDPSFYEEERVVVWGTVKARTLDDPVNLKVSCFVEKSEDEVIEGTIIPTSLTEGKEIFTFEEEDIECRFEKGQLEAGTHIVTLAASFNFETESYLKTYFIEQERKRAMTREKIDIFDEFGITDKKPKSVNTNGPIRLEMETKTPPTGISLQEDVEVTFIRIEFEENVNWQGTIDDINELVLFVPKNQLYPKKSTSNKVPVAKYLNVLSSVFFAI